MKIKKKSFVWIFLICVVILVYLLKDDYDLIIKNLLLADKSLIFVAIVLIFLYWSFKALSLHTVIRKNGYSISYIKILKQIIINQFFCGITPFAVGGEPMQVYMLNKQGIELMGATNIIIQDFIMYQIALITVGVLSIFSNLYFKLFEFTPLLTKMIILGFTINVLVASFFMLLSFSKKFSKMTVKFLINFLYRFKIIKDKEKHVKNWDTKLKDYNRSADLLKRNKKLFFTCVSIHITEILILYCVPLIVFSSLNYRIGILESITFTAFITLIGNFVPIPGGSGGIEFGFLTFFALIVPDIILKSALILWRFITYYFGLIIGGLLLTLYGGESKE